MNKPSSLNRTFEDLWVRQGEGVVVTEVCSRFFVRTFSDKKLNQGLSSMHEPPSRDGIIDFAIVTAIKVERLAIFKAFGIDARTHRVRKGNRTYWKKEILLNNGKSYSIVVAQAPKMTNTPAALLTKDILDFWHPRALIMAGIAAAASEEDQNLGDIVVGENVLYYGGEKITPYGVSPNFQELPPDPLLWDRVITFELPDNFTVQAERPENPEKSPNVTTGVIVSGENVIANAEVRNSIVERNRKTKAIEMEGYGVAAAVYSHIQYTRCLVIRALCDYGNAEKNDDWQPYAAAAVAEFVKHFLLDDPLEEDSES